jgi:hypothetical protein
MQVADTTPSAESLSSARAWLAGRDLGLVALLGLPFVLLVFDRNWLVNPFGIDPWVYLGYYLNLPNHLRAFDGTYYSTRLTMTVPGWLAYRLLPPLAASYALHLTLYYASVCSLYLILRDTVGRRGALLAAVTLGCHTYFLEAVGWDYSDGFGIAYFLLATWLLSAAVRAGRWRLLLLLAGAAAAALPIANNFYVIYLPFLAAHYVWQNRQGSRRPLFASVLWLTLGGIALVLALSFLSLTLAGRFWFWLPSVQWACKTAGGPNAWRAPPQRWLPEANYLVFPALCALGAFGVLVRRLARGPMPGLFFQVSYLVLVVLFVVIEALAISVLQLHFYASLLLPAAFLAFGGQAALLVDGLTPRQFRALAVVAAGLLVVAAVTPTIALPGGWGAAWVALALAIGVVAFFLLQRPPARAWVAGLAVSLLAVSHLAARQCGDPLQIFMARVTPALVKNHMPQPVPLWRSSPRRFAGVNAARSETLLALCESVRALHAVDPSANTWFWFNKTEPLAEFYTVVASTHNYMYRLYDTEFPDLPAGPDRVGRELHPGARLAILSTSGSALDQAQTALARLGLDARVLLQKDVRRRPIAYTLTLIEAVPRASSRSALAPAKEMR